MTRLVLLALAAALFDATPAQASNAEGWSLWPSPFTGQEVLDQSQTTESPGNSVGVKKDRPVGQVFVPSKSPLLRMEFKVHNRYDARPGRIRLYRWQGDPERTRAAPPIFEDVLELSGDIGHQRRSVFPRLAVEPGAPLFVDFSAPARGEYTLGAATDGKDHYPPGRLDSQIDVSSDLGITPTNDGKVIRLVMPSLTEERRNQMVTRIKQMAEEARVSIRNIRRDANKHSEQAKKKSVLTEDDLARLKEEIQKLTNQHEKGISELLDKKTEEVMKV